MFAQPTYPDPPLSQDEHPYDPINYEECLHCKRQFKLEIMHKHLAICQNVFMKKLVVF